MAYFEGTIAEFIKFVGAYARIKVMHIAAKHKKNIGKCEECGLQTRGLEAAHIKGRKRRSIISNILSEFTEGEVVKIDLQDFEEKFIAAHLPIEKNIRILCKECHRRYDNEETDEDLITAIPDLSATMEDEKRQQAEAKEVERKVKPDALDKGRAIQIVNRQTSINATSKNTLFSNISLPDCWWLQTNNEKFKYPLHIVLNNPKLKKLYLFKIPANTITNPRLYFKQRNDNYKIDNSDIYIPVSSITFKEKSNRFDLTRFLVETIAY
jgi:hypothetical protein